MNNKLLHRTTLWCFVIILLGIGFRSFQYLGSSSMWFDELSSARNIESRTFYELSTQSLDYNQVAPVGFLLSQKLMLTIFGADDLVHRFLPWLASIFAIFLFWFIAKHYLDGIKLISSLTFICGSIMLLWLAVNAKQYSGDIAVSLFFVWSGLVLSDNTNKNVKIWIVAILGGLCALMSFPGALMAFLILALVLWQRRKEWNQFKSSFLKVGSFWTIGAILNLLYAQLVVDKGTTEAMKGWWSDGFPPSLNPIEFIPWFINKATNLTAQFIVMIPAPPLWSIAQILAWIIFILCIVAIVYGITRIPVKIILLLTPVLLALLLSFAGIYPWRQRVAMFSVWPFFILAPLGLVAFHKWSNQKIIPSITISIASVMGVIPFLIMVYAFSLMPFQMQPSEPVLKEVKSKLKPGDKIYVYTKALHAMNYYGPKVGIETWISGNYFENASGYKKDIDSIRGEQRVWFFYTQWTKAEPFPDSIRVYFQKVGEEVLRIKKPATGSGQEIAAAYLYDLSIPSK